MSALVPCNPVAEYLSQNPFPCRGVSHPSVILFHEYPSRLLQVVPPPHKDPQATTCYGILLLYEMLRSAVCLAQKHAQLSPVASLQAPPILLGYEDSREPPCRAQYQEAPLSESRKQARGLHHLQ